MIFLETLNKCRSTDINVTIQMSEKAKGTPFIERKVAEPYVLNRAPEYDDQTPLEDPTKATLKELHLEAERLELRHFKIGLKDQGNFNDVKDLLS